MAESDGWILLPPIALRPPWPEARTGP